MQHAPWSPPLVEMSGGQVGHLLAWDQHERDGSWQAWVSWVQVTGDPPRPRHKVVAVQAATLAPLEEPEAYRDVPRRVLGNDGQIRPWSPAGLDAQRPRSVALLRQDDGLVRVGGAEVSEHRSLRCLGSGGLSVRLALPALPVGHADVVPVHDDVLVVHLAS